MKEFNSLNIKGHQGDVQVATINALPDEAVEIKNFPIALGEIHGHAHVFTGDVKRYKTPDNRILFSVGRKGAVIQHVNISIMSKNGSWETLEELPIADHKPVRVGEGVYECWIQNAYNPYSKMMEKVLD